MHTYISTFIHTYIHTYVHTYIRTYTHKNGVRIHVHTYIHASVHTYTHAYIHTRIHTYIHGARECMHTRVSMEAVIYSTPPGALFHPPGDENQSSLSSVAASSLAPPRCTSGSVRICIAPKIPFAAAECVRTCQGNRCAFVCVFMCVRVCRAIVCVRVCVCVRACGGTSVACRARGISCVVLGSAAAGLPAAVAVPASHCMTRRGRRGHDDFSKRRQPQAQAGVAAKQEAETEAMVEAEVKAEAETLQSSDVVDQAADPGRAPPKQCSADYRFLVFCF